MCSGRGVLLLKKSFGSFIFVIFGSITDSLRFIFDLTPDYLFMYMPFYHNGIIALKILDMNFAFGVNKALVYRCGMSEKDRVCLEWIKQNTLKWFGHMKRMHDNRLIEMMYRNKIEGSRIRVR